MIFKVKKSTIGEYNGGVTSGNSNCYYKGSSVCWIVSDNNIDYIALTRKQDAIAMAEYFNKINWDRQGDPLIVFKNQLIHIGDFETVEKIKEL